MKTRRMVVLAAASLMLLPAAQAQQEGRRERSPLDEAGRARRPERAQRMDFERIRQALDLDEGQQAEFDRIADEFRQKQGGGAAASLDRRRELLEEMRQAREAGDDKRVAEIREQLRASRGSRPEEFLDQIEPILREDQLEKLAQIREQMASRRDGDRAGRTRDPLARLKDVRAELDLTEEQADRYDQAYAELVAQVEKSRGQRADVDDLIKQLMEAAEAGDTERIKELRAQLPDPRAQTEEAIGEFFDKVEGFLTPEQMEMVERCQQQTPRGAGRGEERVGLRQAFRFVGRLDLDPEQHEALRVLQRESRERERDARRDPAARARVVDEVLAEMRGILKDEQKAEFDEWLAKQKGEKRDRGQGPDRPRRPGRGKTPGEPREEEP